VLSVIIISCNKIN